MTCTEGHHILPNLKNLLLSGYARPNMDYLHASGLKSLVLSRWWPDGPDGDGSVSFRNRLSCLQNVTLSGFRVIDFAEDIAHISALANSGCGLHASRI
ncbi:hypothetical protein BT96DRAFT_915687, partial [Gymnopus androsaceus JB14]